jgi:HemX protein
MVLAAHAIAISCYLGAVLIAAVPLARPVRTPVAGVAIALAVGLLAHGLGLAALAQDGGAAALTGLGPSLSFAGFAVAFTLLVVELLTREVTLTLAAAPLAALSTMAGNIAGLQPMLDARGARGVWLALHIVIAFAALAAYATAAAAGTMYLVAHRDLKSRRFGAIFRSFPPLATLDRVNHLSLVAGFFGLTLAIALAAGYSLAYRAIVVPQIVWGGVAWIALAVLTLGRLRGVLQARRAAVVSAVTFVCVLALYVVVRITADGGRGQFL